MITKVASLSFSEELLNEVVRLVGGEVECEVGCFEEGAEQGFSITSDSVDSEIIFAQSKGGDAVVYRGGKNQTIGKFHKVVCDKAEARRIICEYLVEHFGV